MPEITVLLLPKFKAEAGAGGINAVAAYLIDDPDAGDAIPGAGGLVEGMKLVLGTRGLQNRTEASLAEADRREGRPDGGHLAANGVSA